jgi:hypothetical protein
MWVRGKECETERGQDLTERGKGTVGTEVERGWGRSGVHAPSSHVGCSGAEGCARPRQCTTSSRRT